MKQAYLSFVWIAAKFPSHDQVVRIDELLRLSVRAHEIVIVLPFGELNGEKASELRTQKASGPVTLLEIAPHSGRDVAAVAGLARASGDFVFCWEGDAYQVSDDLVFSVLNFTNQGFELVEVSSVQESGLTRAFLKVANLFRPRSTPIRRNAGYLLSRHALGQVLLGATVDPELSILLAELPVQRTTVPSSARRVVSAGAFPRIREGIRVLSKGTRLGSLIPLILAAISAGFAFAAAVYALLLFVVSGRSPEGWTTLMVVTGLGQAAILVMMGLLWSRLDDIARGFSRRVDATSHFEVIPPRE